MFIALLIVLYFSVTKFLLRRNFHFLKQGDDLMSKAMADDIEKHIFPNIHGITSVDIALIFITASLAVTSKALSIYTLIIP
jgi:hypothetical protein